MGRLNAEVTLCYSYATKIPMALLDNFKKIKNMGQTWSLYVTLQENALPRPRGEVPETTLHIGGSACKWLSKKA